MARNPYSGSLLSTKATGLYSSMDPWFGAGVPLNFIGGSMYEAMRKRPGTNHPWVYAVISTMLDAYIQCPIRLRNTKNPKGELIDAHPLLDLLKAPNPHMSGTNFLEMIVWCLDLTTPTTAGGQCFIWGGDKENFRKGQIPDELWLQNDAGVKAILNDQKILQEWELNYTGTSPYDYGAGFRLGMQEVIRVNLFNPYTLLAGVAPGQAVRVGIENDSRALELNANMITSGGQARGVYTAKKPMTAEQMKEFKANLTKYSEGVENAGKDKYLPWEMDYTQLTLTPEDMQYAESLGTSMDWILAVHKVSKFAVQQYEDLNYATAKEAKRQLFEQAIIRIMQELNQGWVSNIDGRNLELCVDMSKVAALHDDLDARWKRAQIAVELGIPPLIALKMNDIPTDDLKGMAWLMENQSSNAAMERASAVNADPAAADTKPGDKKPAKFYNIKAMLTSEQRRAMAADYVTKVFDPAEKPMQMGVRKFIQEQRNRNLDLVDAWAAKHAKAVKAEGDEPQVSDFILDIKRENTLLGLAMRPHFEAVTRFSEGYAQAQIEAVRMHPVQLQIKDATEAFLLRRLKYLSTVNRTTFDGVEKQLADVLATARASEMSNQEIAKAIRDSMQETYDKRARPYETMRIARTETCVLAGYVQYAAGKDAGMERKGWGDTEDAATRPTHVKAGDQGLIPYDQPFDNGLDYPGDPTGEAAEVIHCRCYLRFGGPA